MQTILKCFNICQDISSTKFSSVQTPDSGLPSQISRKTPVPLPALRQGLRSAYLQQASVKLHGIGFLLHTSLIIECVGRANRSKATTPSPNFARVTTSTRTACVLKLLPARTQSNRKRIISVGLPKETRLRFAMCITSVIDCFPKLS